MPVVYALSLDSSPKDFRYIGITKFDDPYIRLKGHVKKAKAGSTTHVSNWIRKAIKNNEQITCTVIAYSESYHQCTKIEKRFIALYRDNGINLTNMTDGGEGSSRYIQSKESNEKRSKTLRKVLADPAIRKKISDANTGKVMSLETRKKIGSYHKGKIVSKQTRQKLSEVTKGKKHSLETRRKMSSSQKKRRAT